MKRKIIVSSIVLLVVGCIFYLNSIQTKISEVFFKKGEYFFSEKKYNVSLAEKFYKLAILVDCAYPKAHYQLGRIYFLNGDLRKALSEFSLELSKHPEDKQVYYMAGLSKGYARQYEEAISDFTEYIKANPQTWAAYNDLAWVYLTKNDFEKAKETAENGLKNDSGNPWLNSNLGIALLNLGRLKEAEDKLLLAKSIGDKLSSEDWKKVYPGNSPQIAENGINEFKAAINLNLAIACKKMGDKKMAEKYYGEYLAMLPENDNRKISTDIFLLMP